MKKLHWQICEAPICADERCYKDQPNWKKEIVWFPGEVVCQKKPFTKWQKRQSQINRWNEKGEFRYPNRYFTVSSLLRGYSLRKGRLGGDADGKIWVKEQKKGGRYG